MLGDLMEYEELLKRAKKMIPNTNEEKGRFEVPKAMAIQIGKQTVIKNFAEICKTIRREPQLVAKYLFKELAVPGSISGNELSLLGKIYSNMISQRIDEYVKLYVLCSECKKPDTSLVKEGGIFVMKCEACGARKTLK